MDNDIPKHIIVVRDTDKVAELYDLFFDRASSMELSYIEMLGILEDMKRMTIEDLQNQHWESLD